MSVENETNPSRPRPVLLAVVALLAMAGSLLLADQAVEDIQVVRSVQGSGGAVVPRDAMPGRGFSPGAPVPGTAVVSGTVVSADAGRPIRRASVRLFSVARGAEYTATTDDQGRFQLDKVAEGQFTLTASKPGFLDSTYGQRRPGSGRPGTPISIAEGQRVERLSLPIARGGVLAGTVVDDAGEPAFGTDVRAFKYQWQGGERVLALAGTDKADDRGSYRIAALLPGDYVVMAGGDGGQMADLMMPRIARGASFAAMAPTMVMEGTVSQDSAGYAPVYFPNVRSGGEASTIALDVSEERTGLDLQLPLVPFGQVAGVITSEAGQPVMATEVRLVNADDPLPGLGMRSTVAGPDGQFAFSNVPSGRYRVIAHSGPRQIVMVDQVGGEQRVQMQFMSAAPRGGPGAPLPGPGGRMGMGFDPQNQPAAMWANAEVAVSGRATENVSLTLRRGMTVSGQVTFDDTGPPPTDLSRIRLVLNSAGRTDGGMQSAMGQVGQDGTFTIANVIPGTYRVSVLSGFGWRPKSFDVNGRDALDFLLEVPADRPVANATLTMTTRTSTLAGTVREAAGQPATGYTIVVFAEDSNYWTPQSRRIQATRPATDGQFSVSNLPAGRYRLAALEDLEDGRWFDPAFLKQISGAGIPMTIADGETKTQDIKVTR